jgi:hypothetical protein
VRGRCKAVNCYCLRDPNNGNRRRSKSATPKPLIAPKQCYRHIVLAVRDTHSGLWGALGLSRRRELAYKPLAHPRLSGLVADYAAGYEKWRHQVVKVRAGLPAPHDPRCGAPVCWRYLSVDVPKRGWARAATLLDEHAGRLGELQGRYLQAAAAVAAGGSQAASPAPGVTAGVAAAAAVASSRGGGGGGADASTSSGSGESASEGEGEGEDDDDFSADSERSADSVVVELRSPRRG